MTPAEALEAQPPTRDRPMWLDLPPSARDWIVPGERYSHYLPAALCAEDELAAHDQLLAWDALVGKLIRECLFGGHDARVVRKTAEAVAAVAEQLAVALGARLGSVDA